MEELFLNRSGKMGGDRAKRILLNWTWFTDCQAMQHRTRIKQILSLSCVPFIDILILCDNCSKSSNENQ